MGIFNRNSKKRSFFPEDLNPIFSSSSFTMEQNPTVRSCVDKIANTLSTLPMMLYVHTKSGKKLATFSPLFGILQNPAYEESPTLFYKTMVTHILLEDGAFIHVSRKNGQIVCLSLCDPKQVTVSRSASNEKLFSIGGRTYTEKDILHIPYPGSYNGTTGQSPVKTHRQLIELDNKMLAYIDNYFDNSLGNRYAVKFGDSYNQKADIQKFYASMVPALKKFVIGAKNAGSQMVLPPDSELQKVEQPSNAEAELHSLLKMVENQICLAFSVPPEVIDSSQSKYGSLEMKQQDFLSNCIQPLGNHICECFERLIGTNVNGAFFIQYEYKNLLTTDTKSTIDYLAKEVQSGLMTINEARSKLGMTDVDDEFAGDVFFIPANLMPATKETVDAYMAKSKLALEIDHAPQGDDKA